MLFEFPRWHTRAPSDSCLCVCLPLLARAKDPCNHQGPGWKAEGFLKLIFLNYVSEPPSALAETVFSRGLNVLTPGPAGFPRARSSRQCPDSAEGSWLPTPYVNRSFHHPWWSSPSFPSVSLLLPGNEYSSEVDQARNTCELCL